MLLWTNFLPSSLFDVLKLSPLVYLTVPLPLFIPYLLALTFTSRFIVSLLLVPPPLAFSYFFIFIFITIPLWRTFDLWLPRLDPLLLELVDHPFRRSAARTSKTGVGWMVLA